MASASLLLLQKLRAVKGPKINPRGNQIKKQKYFMRNQILMLSLVRLELQAEYEIEGNLCLVSESNLWKGESDFCYTVGKHGFLSLPVSDRREGFTSPGKAYGYRSSDGVYC